MCGALAQEAAHVEDGPQRHATDDAEGDDRGGVGVDHGMGIGPGAQDFAVDEAL